MVQWLRLHASNAGGTGLVPDRGTEIRHATRCGQKKNFFFSLKKKNTQILKFTEVLLFFFSIKQMILSHSSLFVSMRLSDALCLASFCKS